MITYLKDGWYTRLGQRRLRNEVVDGAIDTASLLFRAAVPPQAITALALKVRALATIAEPAHRQVRPGGFVTAERAALTQRLQTYTDRFPVLQSFITDCFEHVHDANELRALYLHLIHVTQMMQILTVAKLSGAAAELLSGIRRPADAGAAPAAAEVNETSARQPRKKVAAKKKTKKKVGKQRETPQKPARKVAKKAAKRK